METVADELSTNQEKDYSPLSSPLPIQSLPSSEDITTNFVLQSSCSNTSQQSQLPPTIPHQSETVQIQNESLHEIQDVDQATIIPSYSSETPPPLPPPINPTNMNTTPLQSLSNRKGGKRKTVCTVCVLYVCISVVLV